MLHRIGTVTEPGSGFSGMTVYFDDSNTTFVLADKRPVVASWIAGLDAGGGFQWESEDGRAWLDTVTSASQVSLDARDGGSSTGWASALVCLTGTAIVLLWMGMLGAGDPWAALGPLFLSGFVTACYLLALIWALRRLGRLRYLPEDSVLRRWARAQFFVCLLVAISSVVAAPLAFALAFYFAPVPAAAFVGGVIGAFGTNRALRADAAYPGKSPASVIGVLAVTLVALAVLPGVAMGIWNYTRLAKSTAETVAMTPTTPATAPDKYEPDDTSATAHPVTVGGLAEEHTLYPLNDVDYLVVDLPGGSLYYLVELGAPQALVVHMHTDAAGGVRRDETAGSAAASVPFPLSYRRSVSIVAPNRQPTRWYIRVNAPAGVHGPYAYRIRVHPEF